MASPARGNQGNRDMDNPTQLSAPPVSGALGVIGFSGRASLASLGGDGI